ncbi:MAG: response regulator [candidate division Zixibacteria bacterium]|nr:response regulator [candidate division Zixibacteria bacterium]
MPNHRILVVDDEVFVRDLLQEFLGKQGYDVSLAESGEAAIQHSADNDVDVALVDLKMPGIDGLETLKRMRDIDPNTPIIIMTGYPTIETSIKALRLGAYDYVIKPFKLNELKAAVEKALKERKLKVEIDSLRNKIKSIEGELEKYDVNENNMPEAQNLPDELDNDNGQENGDGILSQIRQLGELKDKGIITDKEFEEKKSELLSRL